MFHVYDEKGPSNKNTTELSELINRSILLNAAILN